MPQGHYGSRENPENVGPLVPLPFSSSFTQFSLGEILLWGGISFLQFISFSLPVTGKHRLKSLGISSPRRICGTESTGLKNGIPEGVRNGKLGHFTCSRPLGLPISFALWDLGFGGSPRALFLQPCSRTFHGQPFDFRSSPGGNFFFWYYFSRMHNTRTVGRERLVRQPASLACCLPLRLGYAFTSCVGSRCAPVTASASTSTACALGAPPPEHPPPSGGCHHHHPPSRRWCTSQG